MVGNLAFANTPRLAQLRELNAVGRHCFMKRSARNHQLGLHSPLRGALNPVKLKTPRGKRRGWMQSDPIPGLRRGEGQIFLLTSLSIGFPNGRGPHPLWAQMAEPPDPFLSCLRTAQARLLASVVLCPGGILRQSDFPPSRRAR
jgi:hypothetical protein